MNKRTMLLVMIVLCGVVMVSGYDNPPDDRYTCAQQKAWGKCTASWMEGHCTNTCAGVVIIADTEEFAAGFAQGYMSETMTCGDELSDFENGASEIASGLEGLAGCFDNTGADCSSTAVQSGWSAIKLGFQNIERALAQCESQELFDSFLKLLEEAVPEVALVADTYEIIVNGRDIAGDLEHAWTQCKAEQWFNCGDAIGDLAALLKQSMVLEARPLATTTTAAATAAGSTERAVLAGVGSGVGIAVIVAGVVIARRRGRKLPARTTNAASTPAAGHSGHSVRNTLGLNPGTGVEMQQQGGCGAHEQGTPEQQAAVAEDINAL